MSVKQIVSDPNTQIKAVLTPKDIVQNLGSGVTDLCFRDPPGKKEPIWRDPAARAESCPLIISPCAMQISRKISSRRQRKILCNTVDLPTDRLHEIGDHSQQRQNEISTTPPKLS